MSPNPDASQQKAGSLRSRFGALAQLVERFHGMEEVRGSIPLGSTSFVGAFGASSLTAFWPRGAKTLWRVPPRKTCRHRSSAPLAPPLLPPFGPEGPKRSGHPSFRHGPQPAGVTNCSGYSSSVLEAAAESALSSAGSSSAHSILGRSPYRRSNS